MIVVFIFSCTPTCLFSPFFSVTPFFSSNHYTISFAQFSSPPPTPFWAQFDNIEWSRGQPSGRGASRAAASPAATVGYRVARKGRLEAAKLVALDGIAVSSLGKSKNRHLSSGTDAVKCVQPHFCGTASVPLLYRPSTASKYRSGLNVSIYFHELCCTASVPPQYRLIVPLQYRLGLWRP